MNRKRILIVEDDIDIVELLTYNLEKEGYVLGSASNGVLGYQKMISFRPDLILLDIMMPEMDGIELCNKIRSQKEFDEILIAFLTARGESFTQVTALDAGGDDFIAKPIKPSVLKSRIKALLRRSKRHNEEVENAMAFGDLEIDSDSFTVTVGSTKLDLTKKEFELLRLLTSRPGKVFKREAILSKVWGNEVVVGDRTIDVHVRKLREKIGSHYIKTLKGVGYKFVF